MKKASMIFMLLAFCIVCFAACDCGGDDDDDDNVSISDDSDCVACSTTSDCLNELGFGWGCVGKCCEQITNDTQDDDTHIDDTVSDDTGDDTTPDDDSADDTSDDTSDDDSADDTMDDDTATDDTTDDTSDDDSADDTAIDDTADDDTVDDGTWLFVGFNPNTTEPTPEFYEYDHGTLTALDLPDIGIKMINSIQRAPDGKQWIIAYTQYHPYKKQRRGGKEIWWPGATAVVILVRDPQSGSFTVYDQNDFPSWSIEMNFLDIAFLSNGDVFVPATGSISPYFQHTNYGIYHFNSASSEWTYELLPIQYDCTGINSVVTNGDEVYAALYDYTEANPYDGGRPVIFHRTDSGWVEMDIDFTDYNSWFTDFIINPDGVFYVSFLWRDLPSFPPFIYKIIEGSLVPIDPDRPSWTTTNMVWWRDSLFVEEQWTSGIRLERSIDDQPFYTFQFIAHSKVLPIAHLRTFNDFHACLTVVDYINTSTVKPFTAPYLVDGGDNFEQPDIVETLYSTDCLYVPDEQ